VTCIPKSQKATRTELSAPAKTALNLALYSAHDEPGEPGIGRESPEDDGERFIVLSWYYRKIVCSAEYMSSELCFLLKSCIVTPSL
jgi:hypothetical protein